MTEFSAIEDLLVCITISRLSVGRLLSKTFCTQAVKLTLNLLNIQILVGTYECILLTIDISSAVHAKKVNKKDKGC